MEMFYGLTGVVVIQVCTHLSKLPNCALECIHYIVYKLYLDRDDF